MNSTAIDTAALARNLLLVSLTVSLGLVLRVAHDWYPFTPTFTSVEKRWVGWPDILRWGLSGIFLFIVPFAYVGTVLVYVSKSQAFYIPLSMPTIREALRIVALFLLAIPFLGFYDIWQSIVRTWPRLFYSAVAKKTIEERFSSAFTSGRIATFLIGLVWIFVPFLILAAVQRY